MNDMEINNTEEVVVGNATEANDETDMNEAEDMTEEKEETEGEVSAE